jgi:aspartate racemase
MNCYGHTFKQLNLYSGTAEALLYSQQMPGYGYEDAISHGRLRALVDLPMLSRLGGRPSQPGLIPCERNGSYWRWKNGLIVTVQRENVPNRGRQLLRSPVAIGPACPARHRFSKAPQEEEKPMKMIGIIGGMSWESSADYYRLINENVKSRLGPTHSAELLMYSVDFHVVANLELQERWGELATLLIDAARRLESAGARFVILASNTAHKVAEIVERSINIPLMHIADVAAEEVKRAGISAVGLLGTRFVMEQDFYKDKFRARGINVVVPERAARDYVHNVIFHELCVGKMIPESKEQVRRIILDLGQAGVVLACTELPLLLHAEDTPVRLFDSMAFHAEKAVELALEE